MEYLPLAQAGGRILGQQLIAKENVPAFNRSPYDGYAFHAADTKMASADNPVVFRVLEQIPAGSVSTKSVSRGTASKVFTGSSIPDGADAVIKYEKTKFTDDYVTVCYPLNPGENIVRAGEDIRKGAVLAECGDVIDPGLAGVLAAQGEAMPLVYKIPKVAFFPPAASSWRRRLCPEAEKSVIQTAICWKYRGADSLYCAQGNAPGPAFVPDLGCGSDFDGGLQKCAIAPDWRCPERKRKGLYRGYRTFYCFGYRFEGGYGSSVLRILRNKGDFPVYSEKNGKTRDSGRSLSPCFRIIVWNPYIRGEGGRYAFSRSSKV